jgi:tetratricopeptide (TPR) repeat protein
MKIMKKTFSILLLLGLMLNSFAQDTYVALNYNAIEKKLNKSNADIKHPKKSNAAKTWLTRGEILMDVYNVDIDQLFEGMDKITVKAIMKEPVSTSTETIGGEQVEVQKYPRVNLYFQNNRLARWEKTKYIVDNPLDDAYSSLMKASELDTDGKSSKKIQEAFTKLKDLFKQSGLAAYYTGDKKKAIDEFMKVLEINETDYFKGEIDTVMIQYSGIIAREINDMETAIKQYERLTEINYGGPNTYLLLKEDYMDAGDTAAAIDVLERAFEVYPDSVGIVANLIDLYIRNDKIAEGLTTIDKSISNHPERGEFYYWKGRLYLNSDDESRVDDALKVYLKAIEVDPTIYYVYYDIGLIYYLQGQDLFTQAGTEKDKATRELMNQMATEKFESAIPMLESSIEHNDSYNEIMQESLDTLKRIYYRLQMTDKYEETDRKLNELRNK